MSRAFVVRTGDFDIPGYAVPGVFQSLKDGKARIGWSYADDLDLRVLRDHIIRGEWNLLTPDQKDAWGCQRFLEEVEIGDYLVYLHQPQREKLCIVRVTGDYDYAPATDSLDGDFRSYRLSQLLTPTPIGWRDPIVPSAIQERWGVPRRFWELKPFDQFMQFVEAFSGLQSRVIEAAEHDRIDPTAAAHMIAALATSIARQTESLR